MLGFRSDNLDFLPLIPTATRVWFWDCTFSSVEGIYALRNLSYCGVMDKRPGIDFGRFPNLETLVVHWNGADSGWPRTVIRKLYIWHYNPRDKSFADLQPLPPLLEHLEMTWFNPSSLAGISALPDLKVLELHWGRNLVDLSILPSLAPSLKKLIVTKCKRLTNFDGILNHQSLELAIADGQRIRG